MMHGERIWRPYAAFARSPVRQRRGGTPVEADDETAAIPVAADDGGTPAEADDETAEIPVAADDGPVAAEDTPAAAEDGPAVAEEGCGPGFGVTPDARVGECGTGLLLSGAEGTEGTTESEGRR